MNTALLIARLLLAGVFALAGLTKLADLDGSRAGVAGFGVPERLARPTGTVLPIGELVVAGLLLSTGWARWGAVGAIVLLAIFVLAISRSMIRGEAPDCHCFGRLHSEPAGWKTLVRNALLAGVAGFVLGAGAKHAGTSATAWIGRLSPAGTVALVTAVVGVLLSVAAAFALLALLRQNGRLLLRIDGLESRLDSSGVAAAVAPAQPHAGLALGMPGPEFSLSGLYGETVTRDSLIARERPVLLLFTDPGCGPCNAMMPQIAAWQQEHSATLTIAVITRGAVDDNRGKSREHGVSSVWLDDSLTVYKAYQAIGTPGAVLLDAEGRIASPVVGGADAIGALVRQATGSSPDPVVQVLAPGPARVPTPASAPPPAPSPTPPPVGADAPSVNLIDLGGQRVQLAAEDRDTLVLFWNPGCGFCNRMLPDLQQWESNPPAAAPRLVLVSSGTAEEVRAMNLKSRIALDQSFGTGSAFGTTGTPSAVLVDRHGKVASAVAVGAPAVMQLAAGRDLSPDARHR
jgi:thiol-disulfide isomerase/thioredoxin